MSKVQLSKATYYPSSSKNLTTTLGVLANPSRISFGRLSTDCTSPGQNSPPHLHHTTSPCLKPFPLAILTPHTFPFPPLQDVSVKETLWGG